jgi:hypothetical protein
VAARLIVGNHVRVHSYPQARQQARQIADSGDLPRARAVLERVVDLGRPGLATGDPELLATMRQLAGLYAQDDDPTAARRLLEEAYAAGQRSGPADPLMVLLAYDLAVVAEELANRHEARKNFALVAEYGPAALGEGHPAVSHARDYAAEGSPAAADEASSPTTQLPVSSAPVLGSPVSGSPVSGSPTALLPVFMPPVSGSPVSGSPVPGSPVFRAPVSGTPVSPPHFRDAPGDKTPRSRTPWVIAAAAVVFAVVMLVVVLVRPDAQPDSGTLVADATSAPAAPPPASAPATTEPTSAPATSPTTTGPKANAQATSKPIDVAPTTTTPRPATAAVTRIVGPKNGSGVARQFTVTFTVSAADVAATGTRLALTVCVQEWCFLDGPIVIEDGVAKDYTVTLGTNEGEGIGEKWTVRIDRLSQPTYDYLQGHKQAAVDNGTWGKGVTTPTDRLNKTPVSSVVVTKTS